MEEKVRFGAPKTDALYFKFKERYPRSLLQGPIYDELWRLCWQSEKDLKRAKDMRQIYPEVVLRVRETARVLGYAICVHGTQGRDIDLVAVPWVVGAASPRALAIAVSYALQGYFYDRPDYEPGHKPHGRVAYTILFKWAKGVTMSYVDLSIMPRRKELPVFLEAMRSLWKWIHRRRKRVKLAGVPPR